MAIHKGIIIHHYLDDWLVKATSHRGCLRHTLDLVKICQSLGYQFDLMAGRVRPIYRTIGRTFGQILEILSLPVCPVQQFMSDRFTNSHRKAISSRPTSQETHTVASQKQLEGTRVTRKGDSNTKVFAPTFTRVVARGQCPYRPTITPK